MSASHIVLVFMAMLVDLLAQKIKRPFNATSVMTLEGIRGAVTLALALSLPVELDYWYSIQSIAYGVVLFTLFIQTPIMPAVIRKFT